MTKKRILKPANFESDSKKIISLLRGIAEEIQNAKINPYGCIVILRESVKGECYTGWKWGGSIDWYEAYWALEKTQDMFKELITGSEVRQILDE